MVRKLHACAAVPVHCEMSARVPLAPPAGSRQSEPESGFMPLVKAPGYEAGGIHFWPLLPSVALVGVEVVLIA